MEAGSTAASRIAASASLPMSCRASSSASFVHATPGRSRASGWDSTSPVIWPRSRTATSRCLPWKAKAPPLPSGCQPPPGEIRMCIPADRDAQLGLILCAEDQDSLRTDICDELREAGYGVLEATDGDETLRQIQEIGRASWRERVERGQRGGTR